MALILSEQDKIRCMNYLFAGYHQYTLRSHRFGTHTIYIRYPTADDLTAADIAYDKAMDHLRWDDFYDRESIQVFMKKHRVDGEESDALELDDEDPIYYWTKQHDDKIKECETTIETIKEKYYQNFDNRKRREELRSNLETTNRMYNELSVRKHSFDFLTKESVASKMYARALYLRIVCDENMRHIREIPPFVLDNIARMVHEKEMSIFAMIREVSHTSPWVNHHTVFKRDPFGKQPLNGLMTSLISYSRWYEAIPSYDDYPYRKDGEEQIVDDDIAIDGWYQIARRKMEEERLKGKQKLAESGKFNEENFVMAATPEEAAAVYERNSKIGKNIIANRIKQVSDLGSVENHKLADNLMDLTMEANKMEAAAAAAKQAGKQLVINGR